MKITKLLSGVAIVGSTMLVGCSEVDYGDVQAARDKVNEEQRETAEARREAAENIQRETEETADAKRHEALKPAVPENVREEEKETQEAREEGREAVAEEEKETREAVRELEETKKELAAKQARDAFVADADATIERAESHIDLLQEQASKQEGVAKEDTNKRIEALESRVERAQDELSEVKNAELLEWESHRAQAQLALDDLKGALNDAS